MRYAQTLTKLDLSAVGLFETNMGMPCSTILYTYDLRPKGKRRKLIKKPTAEGKRCGKKTMQEKNEDIKLGHC